MTEMGFNTSLINILSKYGISVHFFNYYNFYTGSFYPKEQNISGKLLVKQVEYFSNDDKRLVLAKEFVKRATEGILRNLRYYNERGKNVKEFIEIISNLKRHIDLQTNISELMGIEGNIHKVYYDSWNTIIDKKINFEKRVKRPPI